MHCRFNLESLSAPPWFIESVQPPAQDSSFLGVMPGGVSMSQLAPPAVSLLIAILAYGSQIFFQYIEPYKLQHQQILVFNTAVGCIWICYARACWTAPGRVPINWVPDGLDANEQASRSHRCRWCKKCQAFKPPRAHHCKTCNRYHNDHSIQRFYRPSNHYAIDAYQRWIITVHGPSIAFRIVPFPISCVSFSMRWPP